MSRGLGAGSDRPVYQIRYQYSYSTRTVAIDMRGFNVTKKEYGGGPAGPGDLLSNTVWYRVPNAPNSKRMVLNPGPPAPDHLP